MTPAEKLLKESVSFLVAENAFRNARSAYQRKCVQFSIDVGTIDAQDWISRAKYKGEITHEFSVFKKHTKQKFDAMNRAKNDLKNAKRRFQTAARNYKNSVK